MLTKTEDELLDKLKECVSLFKEITLYGETRNIDLSEIFNHIHYLQLRVKSQATTRMYPDKFRLLGLSFEEFQDTNKIYFIKNLEEFNYIDFINLDRKGLYCYKNNSFTIHHQSKKKTKKLIIEASSEYFNIKESCHVNEDNIIQQEIIITPIKKGIVDDIKVYQKSDLFPVIINMKILDELIQPTKQ